MKKLFPLLLILFASCATQKYHWRMVVLTEVNGKIKPEPITGWQDYHVSGTDTVRQITNAKLK